MASLGTVSWKSHLSNSVDVAQQGIETALETGDLENTAWNYFYQSQACYFAGHNLADLTAKLEREIQAIQKIEQPLQLEFNAIIHQAVLNLTQSRSEIGVLNGAAADETVLLEQYKTQGISQGLACLYLHKSILFYLSNEFDLAFENIELASQHISSVLGQFIVAVFYYYDALICAAVYHSSSGVRQADLIDRILQGKAFLRRCANGTTTNFLHKFHLVAAEEKRLAGAYYEASDLYDLAISGAKENDFLQEESLANELAAKCYLNRGKEKVAAGYMQEAYYGYARWGAQAKTDALVQHYPTLLQPILQQVAQPAEAFNPLETIIASQLSIHTSTHANPQTSRTSTTNINTSLDFTAVVKASQVLSSTIELEDLLRQLTQIILQNSGGDRCALILADTDGTWQLKALATPDNTDLLSEPLAGHPKLPLKLIQYVKNTQETVVINKLETDLPVIDDFLEKSMPQSLLCLPLLNQGKLLGILYLRNRNTCGAFTQERIHILGFLCTQAAISLENARLYQQAQTYTQQLEQSQLQTVKAEKMASLGNLVAGVAHEINNPIGFLNGSIKNSQTYLQELSEHLALYQQHHPPTAAPVQENAEDIDLDFLLEDFPKLLDSMTAANQRIKSISTSLRTFSRADTEHKVSANLHEGLDSTLLILKYRLKGNENRPAD